jgi:metal-responsive CopG/Arc/MetJ family transcriptional regulator
MSDETILGVRLPDELLARLDEERERMASLVPGAKITRSDVVRALLMAGLEVRERAVRVGA